jgi:CRP/FNR family transcriptional regulator
MQTLSERSNEKLYRNGEFFNMLSAPALADFEKLLVPISHPANHILFSETQSSTGIFVVIEGEVKLSMNSSDGRRLSLTIVKAGEILGLSSALSGKPHEITADTLYPARIAHISRQAFLHFLARHPEAYEPVTRAVSRHFDLVCDQLRMVGLSTSVPERLARLLLGWSDTGERPESSSRCRISLTHEQIGEFIGASRETVTRTLSTFKSRHLVAQNGSTLTIPSRMALESYARG